MPTQVTFLIQVELPDMEEDEHQEQVDALVGHLENAVEWPDVKLVGSEVESEDYYD